jgi:hypothetical protein
MVRANLPVSAATARGHLDLNRQHAGKKRKKRQASPPSPAAAGSSDEQEDLGSAEDRDVLIVGTADPSKDDQALHSDLTGKFPYMSSTGNQYLPVSVLNWYIHLEPMLNRKAPSYRDAFLRTYQFNHTHRPCSYCTNLEFCVELVMNCCIGCTNHRRRCVVCRGRCGDPESVCVVFGGVQHGPACILDVQAALRKDD